MGGKNPPSHLVLSVVRYQMDKKWSKILIIAELDMPILTSIYFKFIEKG